MQGSSKNLVVNKDQARPYKASNNSRLPPKRRELHETILLPKLEDVIIAARELATQATRHDDGITTIELDIESAYRLIPVNEAEQAYLGFEVASP